jgi:Ni/Co efflux regulator RcnB
MKKAMATAIALVLLASPAGVALARQGGANAEGEKPEKADKPGKEAKEAKADKPAKEAKAGKEAKADKPAKDAKAGKEAKADKPGKDAKAGKEAKADKPGKDAKAGKEAKADKPGKDAKADKEQQAGKGKPGSSGQRVVDPGGANRDGWDGKRPGAGKPPRDRDKGRPAYDHARWRPVYVPARKFRPGPYRRPAGWYPRVWSRGHVLPRGWFVASYYLNWGPYGLPVPPVGCEWVRVGDDAILVDIWSGRVISVYRNIFW